ncbi:MAG TPA: hypothetical protein VES21_10875, partial [Nocardioidaceae bacterium]|nr:hypothetical protein [Nocardioidaceae bacterium]
MRSRCMPVLSAEASRVMGSRGDEARLVVDAQAPIALQAEEGLLAMEVLAGCSPACRGPGCRLTLPVFGL